MKEKLTKSEEKRLIKDVKRYNSFMSKLDNKHLEIYSSCGIELHDFEYSEELLLSLLRISKLPTKNVRKHYGFVLDITSYQKHLPESFFIKNFKLLQDMNNDFLNRRDFSEDFLNKTKKHFSKRTWEIVSYNCNMSLEFINDNRENLDVGNLLLNKKLKRSIKDKIRKELKALKEIIS